jgi:hypothetical protein
MLVRVESRSAPRRGVSQLSDLGPASKQAKKFDVSRDDHTALPAVVSDRGMVEIAVQSAESISPTHDSSVNDRVVIWVGWHDERSRTRENKL